jgi:hypothetical protein
MTIKTPPLVARAFSRYLRIRRAYARGHATLTQVARALLAYDIALLRARSK